MFDIKSKKSLLSSEIQNDLEALKSNAQKLFQDSLNLFKEQVSEPTPDRHTESKVVPLEEDAGDIEDYD